MEGLEKYFSQEKLLQILSRLIELRSDYPKELEEGVARYIYGLLMSYAIEAELQYVSEGRPNLVATLPGQIDGPTIIYNGHLDVVPAGEGWHYDPFKATIADGKIYGRGAADMKAGVAAMLYAAILLKQLG